MIFTIGVLACAVLLAGTSVAFHFECLRFLRAWILRFEADRSRLVLTMVGLLTAHIAEIWLYAGAYALLSLSPELGQIHSMSNGDLKFLDLVYYSAMVYTTVGFGDLVPSGGIRLITATEALVGLSLITWSASFTYFLMQEQFGTSKPDR